MMDCEKKDCLYQPMNINCVNCGSKHINYQAEIARQSVTDREIQAAERCVVELIREAHKRNNDSQYAHQEFIREYRDELRSAEKTMLAAIHAYKPEPCEYCDGKQKYKYLHNHHSWNIWKFLDGHYLMKVWTDMGTSMQGISFPISNCPECGRRLQEEQP